jgi:hypothetical protein
MDDTTPLEGISTPGIHKALSVVRSPWSVVSRQLSVLRSPFVVLFVERLFVFRVV